MGLAGINSAPIVDGTGDADNVDEKNEIIDTLIEDMKDFGDIED
jgi:hypothetical protein